MASKEDLQEVLVAKFAELGVKVSKENAWKVYKAGQDAIIETCLKDKEMACSLSGIGRFEIMKAKPRKSKVGVVEFIPRLRFRPSSRVNEALEQALGQVPDPAKIEAVKAKLKSEGKLTSNLPPRVPKAPGAAVPVPAKAAAKATAKAAPKAAPATAPVPAGGAKFEGEF